MAKKSKNKNKTTWFKQCTFETPCEGGRTVKTAWVPEQFGVIGKIVYFGKKTDKPDRLWTVISAGSQRKSGEYISDHERDYLTQRQASDI